MRGHSKKKFGALLSLPSLYEVFALALLKSIKNGEQMDILFFSPLVLAGHHVKI